MKISIGFSDKFDLHIVEDAIELLVEGLHKKFIAVFGDVRFATSFLKRLANPKFLVVALIRDFLVGACALTSSNGSWIKFKANDIFFLLKNVYKVPRLLVYGTSMFHKPKEDELIIDAIVVREGYRGLGIGTRVIYYVINFAKKQGFKRVKLYVAENNYRARKLYEKIGFVVINYLPLRKTLANVLGTKGFYEMMYKIQD